MGFLGLLVFVTGIEATGQFRHIPRERPPPTVDEDYLRCTVETIEKIEGFDKLNVKLYTSDKLANEASLIVESLFETASPTSLVIRDSHNVNREKIVSEKFCVAVVNSLDLLRQVLKLLYREVHHKKCVICVTFRLENPVTNLSSITRKIWTSGVPRNVLFIVSESDVGAIRVIGAPAYSRDNCLRAELVQVGQYREGKFRLEERTGLYPRLNDLGGCELSVMVQPPMLPYVERMENAPGGVVGDFMEMMATSMNFTVTYVWSVNGKDMLNHLYSRDLNLFLDMVPRAVLPATDYRFSLGITDIVFIVPLRHQGQTWARLFSPFDRWTWLSILTILALLGILSFFSKGTDVGSVLLQTCGMLLGTGVHGIMTERGWLRAFLWCFLLPVYVLVQSYLAGLTKDMTVPRPVGQMRTIADLANSKLDVLCTAGTRRGICNMKGKSFGKLCRECRHLTDEEFWSGFYPDLVRTGRMNDSSGIANLEFLEAHPAFLNVHAIEEKVTKVNQLAEVRPGSGWIFEMEEIWERIFASGLVHCWRHRYIDRKRRKAASTNSIRLFRPEFAWSSFFVLTIGWLVSLASFIAELILYRLRKL